MPYFSLRLRIIFLSLVSQATLPFDYGYNIATILAIVKRFIVNFCLQTEKPLARLVLLVFNQHPIHDAALSVFDLVVGVLYALAHGEEVIVREVS